MRLRELGRHRFAILRLVFVSKKKRGVGRGRNQIQYDRWVRSCLFDSVDLYIAGARNSRASRMSLAITASLVAVAARCMVRKT